MNNADSFKNATNNKYSFDLESFVYSSGPDPLRYTLSKNPEFCQYEIKFKDGSSCHVILTRYQRTGITRSKLFSTIKTIGGEGYRKRIKFN